MGAPGGIVGGQGGIIDGEDRGLVSEQHRSGAGVAVRRRPRDVIAQALQQLGGRHLRAVEAGETGREVMACRLQVLRILPFVVVEVPRFMACL